MLSPRYLENLPSKHFTKRNRLTFPGFLNSQHWVFVKEGLDDFRKDCPPQTHQGPKDTFLPLIHHGTPNITLKKSRLPKRATLPSKLSKAEKAFLEDVGAHKTLHPLALYPQLKEALPAEVICLGLREGRRGGGRRTRPKTVLCRCPGSTCYKERRCTLPPVKAYYQLRAAFLFLLRKQNCGARGCFLCCPALP